MTDNSDQRDRFAEAACGGKAGMARSVALSVARRMRHQDRKVGIYRCPWCRLWHVGSKKPGKEGGR